MKPAEPAEPQGSHPPAPFPGGYQPSGGAARVQLPQPRRCKTGPFAEAGKARGREMEPCISSCHAAAASRRGQGSV